MHLRYAEHMTYRYATEKTSYADFAAGRVLLNRAGATSFPVRLADEIFERCAALLPGDGPYRLYDPCCGAGYLLTTLGFLHGARIAALIGSDIDAEWVALARRNLALLTAAGLEARAARIAADLARFGKESHREALESARRLAEHLPPHPIETLCFVAEGAAAPPFAPVDLLIADVPYGGLTAWAGGADAASLLAAGRSALAAHGVAAIISDKGQRPAHPAYRQAGRFSIGRRQIVLLKLGAGE